MPATPLRAAALAACLLAPPALATPVTLGSFTFDSALFGNTLAESDGGSWSGVNWLNVNDANPGNPGSLTGADFNTGIANIGRFAPPTYTIGYATPIVNRPGADLGVVTARYADAGVELTINGVTKDYGAALGQASGVGLSYYYGASTLGPQAASLFVTPIDLSDFGLAANATVTSIAITYFSEGQDPRFGTLSLLRVAGFAEPGATRVPAPPALPLFALGLAGVLLARRRR